MTGGKAVQVVFAANNSAYRSRKRAHRACEQCKSRRKKCPPPFENHERCASCAQDGIHCSLALIDSGVTPPQWLAEEPRDDGSDIDKSALSDKNPRFIGDLNPESVFLTAAEDSVTSDVATDRNEVGVWVSQSPEPLVRNKGLKRRFEDHETIHKPILTSAADSGPGKHLAAYISSLNAYALPTRSCVEMLLSLYLSSIHPLYPIIDEPICALFKCPDKLPTLLLQSMLLVASRHPDAKLHLHLSTSGDPLKPQEFALRLETRIKALLYAEEERDRMVLIRVYALLSLGGGNEDASRHLALAIHHAHSLGLHIRNSKAEDLWWCLWTLDKLQAAMNGRPIFVRLEDVSIDRPTNTRGGKGAVFRVMIKLAELLEAVIALYRPGSEKCWEHKFPDFSDYLRGEEIPKEGGHLVILNLFYYAISILSHRTRNPSSQVRGNSYARRLRAASDVINLLNRNRIPLPPTPILPYAVSLALTTFYARVREGDGECIVEYRSCIDMLTYLGEWWWVAGAMAKLGARAMSSGGKRRAVEKECAAVLTSLKGTKEEGKSGNEGVAHGRTGARMTAVSVPIVSSPSAIRHPIYSESESSASPIMQTTANTPTYSSSYGQVISTPAPLISMPTPAAYQFTNFSELDDATFTGVDMFLLDQFSNPSNPLDFDSLDFNSGLFNAEAVEGMGFGVATCTTGLWGNPFGGSGQHHGPGGWS